MTETVSKANAYLVNGPGTDVAVATKVIAYLVIDTNTVVDPGEVPEVLRIVRWNATLSRRPS